MSILPKKTHTILYVLTIVVGVILLSFAWSMRDISPSSKPHPAYVEEKQKEPEPKPEEKPAEEAKTDEHPLYNNMAAAAIFRAFDTATWECYDTASKAYFVHFDSLGGDAKEFGYVKGWNLMGAYHFIVLGNGTATLKSAGDFSPISFETEGLSCEQRSKEKD